MKKLMIATLTSAFLFTTGCMTVSGKAAGFLYTESKHGEQATANAGNSKEGKACQQSILGLIAMGDASIDKAKDEAGIRKISTVDAETKNYLGLYGTYCTVVRGE